MNRYILDTNICLAYIRGKADFLKQIENRLRLQASNNLILTNAPNKLSIYPVARGFRAVQSCLPVGGASPDRD